MPPRATSQDVLDAVEKLARQTEGKWAAVAQQLNGLSAGQVTLERRMGSLEEEMKQLKACTQAHTTDIAVLKRESAEYDHELQQLQDREREGAIKQAGVAATIAGIMSLILPWIKRELGL